MRCGFELYECLLVVQYNRSYGDETELTDGLVNNAIFLNTVSQIYERPEFQT